MENSDPPPDLPLPLMGPIHIRIESSRCEDSKYLIFIGICTCRPKVMLPAASCGVIQKRYGNISRPLRVGAQYELVGA